MYAWHKQFLEERETVKNESHRRRFQLERSLQLYFFILKEFYTLIFSMNVVLLSFGQNKTRRKRCEFPIRNIILLHDNAQLYTPAQTRQKIENFFLDYTTRCVPKFSELLK